MGFERETASLQGSGVTLEQRKRTAAYGCTSIDGSKSLR
jgi:hypothetical protein